MVLHEKSKDHIQSLKMFIQKKKEDHQQQRKFPTQEEFVWISQQYEKLKEFVKKQIK